MSDRPLVRAASSASARRRGSHALAPAHLGDATAAATVAVIVGGVALVITAIGMLAMALTLGVRWGADPPPNADSLRVLPLLLGLGLLVLGGALTAGGVAVLADARRARLLTGLLSALSALLAAAGTVLVMVVRPPDVVLAIALTIATLVFGIAALLLLRPRH
jgi:hypothetical protein